MAGTTVESVPICAGYLQFGVTLDFIFVLPILRQGPRSETVKEVFVKFDPGHSPSGTVPL